MKITAGAYGRALETGQMFKKYFPIREKIKPTEQTFFGNSDPDRPAVKLELSEAGMESMRTRIREMGESADPDEVFQKVSERLRETIEETGETTKTEAFGEEEAESCSKLPKLRPIHSHLSAAELEAADAESRLEAEKQAAELGREQQKEAEALIEELEDQAMEAFQERVMEYVRECINEDSKMLTDIKVV